MTKETTKLRAVLANLIDACGKIMCDTPEALAMGQAALEAKRALDEPEQAVGAPAPGELPVWQVRYSKVPHHESEITLAVYDAEGYTVCRVQHDGNREQAEANTVLLAAAPELRNTLAGACTVLRGFCDCTYPHCDGCKIGQLLHRLPGGADHAV